MEQTTSGTDINKGNKKLKNWNRDNKALRVLAFLHLIVSIYVFPLLHPWNAASFMVSPIVTLFIHVPILSILIIYTIKLSFQSKELSNKALNKRRVLLLINYFIVLFPYILSWLLR